MKLSGELGYRVRYDVEHNLFHAQNVFNDEYITPTFIEYVQKLEKENAGLKSRDCWKDCEYANPKSELIAQHIKDVQRLTNAKELIENIIRVTWGEGWSYSLDWKVKAEQFLNSEVEK